MTLPDGNYENQGDATSAGAAHIVPAMNAAIAASIVGSYDEASGQFVAQDKTLSRYTITHARYLFRRRPSFR